MVSSKLDVFVCRRQKTTERKEWKKISPWQRKKRSIYLLQHQIWPRIIVFSTDSVQLWPPTHVHLYTICIRVMAHKYKAVSIATVDLILLLVVDILSCSVRPTVGVIPHTDTLSTAWQREQGGRLLHQPFLTRSYLDSGDEGCEIQTAARARPTGRHRESVLPAFWWSAAGGSWWLGRHETGSFFKSSSSSKETCGSKIIYSFGFCTRQHILLAHPARVGPGSGKQSASLLRFAETEDIF